MITKRQEKLKVIYDRGMFLSESRDWDEFWFYTFPNLDIGEDGEVFTNGTSELFISAQKGDKLVRLKLNYDLDKFELDNLSLVFESVSNQDRCYVAPVFKKLTTMCEGKSLFEVRLIGVRSSHCDVQ